VICTRPRQHCLEFLFSSRAAAGHPQIQSHTSENTVYPRLFLVLELRFWGQDNDRRFDTYIKTTHMKRSFKQPQDQDPEKYRDNKEDLDQFRRRPQNDVRELGQEIQCLGLSDHQH